MMQTYAEFRAGLTKEIWPAGEPKNLKPSHEKAFLSAMMDIQKWVPCVRQNKVSIYPFCDTYWENGKTAIELPNGVVSRIFTIANDEWRDKVIYQSSNWSEIECWAKNLFDCPTPLNTGLPKLKTGIFYAEKSTDSVVGRARIGIWAINRRRLYLAPWVQSNEKVIVEWEEFKSAWEDNDAVDTKWWTQDFQEAIKLFVLERHEFFFGDKKESFALKADYAEKLADLMYWCREKTRQQEQDACPDFILTSAQVADDAIPAAADTTYTHALISDWGVLGQPLTDVAARIVELNPSILLTAGDNSYGGAPATLFASFGSLKVYPSFGNHDFTDAPGGVDAEIALFPYIPEPKHYYSVVDGPIQYFLIGNEQSEPDNQYVDANTSTENSIAGGWLQAMLALSTAKWKIVVAPANPYTSDVNHSPGKKWARWPFKLWGADAVLTGDGHVFEDIEKDGLRYIECGLGGNSIRTFGAATDATILKQWNSDYGFLKMVATCSTYTVTLVDRNGNEIYSAELTK